MAKQIGTADNYKDLLDKLIHFLQSKGVIGTPVYTGTGNGVLSLLDTLPQAPTETWALECSNATKVGVADYGATVAADTPVLHWRFNEVAGTNADDATANNRDGTISGTPTLGSTGLLSVDTNKAITFDGVNDKVASAAIAAVQLTGDAAIECIIKPSSISGTRFIMGVGGAGATNAFNYLISLWMVEGYLKIYHEYSAGNVQERTTDFLCAVNRRDHLVLSRDDATDTYSLIVGGIVRHTFQYVFPTSDGTSSVFMVGCDADGLYPFAGVIDEPAIYAAQMTAATAKTHANAALGHETFTVTGTVSGAQANAIVGVPYQNDFIEFRIDDGSTDFIVGDDWSIGITVGVLGAQAWTVNRREVDKVFLQGPGLSATDEVFVLVKTYFDAGADYYNWQLNGADAYSDSADYESQLNLSANAYVPLWNSAIPYWFVANGRRFIVVAKISTTYQSCYAGLVLPFATPLEYPYPLLIGGSASNATDRWSGATNTSTHFVDPAAATYLRHVDAAYNAYNNIRSGINAAASDYTTHPYGGYDSNYASSFWALLHNDPSGAYPLWPITLQDTNIYSATKGVIAILDGCYALSGFSNAAENIVQVDGVDHLVVQNVFRTGISDYWALKLE
jgi:hypothetical protein